MRRWVSFFVIWGLVCALWANLSGAVVTTTDPSGPTIGHNLPKPVVRFVTKTGDTTNTTVETFLPGLGTFPVLPLSSVRYNKMVVSSAAGTVTAAYSPGANPADIYFPDWEVTHTGIYGSNRFLLWYVTTALGPNMEIFLSDATSKTPTSVTKPAPAPENFITWTLSDPAPPASTSTKTATVRGSSDFAEVAPLASFDGNQRANSEYKAVASSALVGTQVLWAEIFTPADGSANRYTFRPWTIQGKESPTYTLSCPAIGNSKVELFDLPQLAVDANRDGAINLASEDASDTTSNANPYRFWLNDDDDGDQSRGEGEFINDVRDHEFNRLFGIRSRRDLEDFARMHINLGGLHDAIVAGNIKIGLKWKEGYSGSPAINVYLSADPTGSDSYVTDATGTTALAQITGDFKNAIADAGNKVTVNTSGPFIFKPEFWSGLNANNPKKHLLFEGDGIGSGQLVMVLLDQNGNALGEGSGVWLDLKDIRSMYLQYRATPDTLPRPFDSLLEPFNSDLVGFQLYPGRPFFQPPAVEDNKVLVFVNGSNESYGYSTSVAETLFKRLWWQGYNGRLVSFRWETLVGPFSGEIPAHYNLNEWLAWNWGKGLRDFVASPNIPTGYTVNVAAHSLGCTVVASALQLGMPASNIVLLQGAIPAGCFDSSGGQSEPDSVNGYERMWEREATKPTPDFSTVLGYRGFVANVGGATIYNFYNEQDYALFFGPLDAWEGNQRINKPDGLDLFSGLAPGLSYQYNPSVSLPASERGRLFFSATGDSRFVITPYESMSFIARSRSKALGAKAEVGDVVNFNVNIGPGSVTNLQDERPDHSGEFSRPIQQLRAFYQEFIKDIGSAPLQ